MKRRDNDEIQANQKAVTERRGKRINTRSATSQEDKKESAEKSKREARSDALEEQNDRQHEGERMNNEERKAAETARSN